jgi:hypothetical protein
MYTNALMPFAQVCEEDSCWFSPPAGLHLLFLPQNVEDFQQEEPATFGDVPRPTLDILTRLAVHAELLTPREERPGHVELRITDTLRDMKLYISSNGGAPSIFKAARNDKRFDYFWDLGSATVASAEAPALNAAVSGQSVDAVKTKPRVLRAPCDHPETFQTTRAPTVNDVDSLNHPTVCSAAPATVVQGADPVIFP